MTYRLTFVAKTAAYRAHAAGCSAAVTTRRQVLLDELHPTVYAARVWADRDESAKAAAPTVANFKACPCTRPTEG